MSNLPYGSTINGMEILHEGNVYDVLFKDYSKVCVDVEGKTTSSESYTKILDTTINAIHYKEIYMINIYNLGLSGSSSVDGFKLYLRLTRTDGDVSISNNVVTLTDSCTKPITKILKKQNANGSINISVFVKNNGSNYRNGVQVEFSYPQNSKNNVVAKNISIDEYNLLETNSDEVIVVDYPIYIFKNEVTFNKNIEVIGNISSKGYLNVYGNITIKGDNCNIGGSTNKLNELHVKNIKCYNTTSVPIAHSKPTENLYNGLSVFHSTLKKIITYYDGKWYSDGVEV